MKAQLFAISLVSTAALFNSNATIVSFQFSGTVTSLNNPSNTIPAGIVYGAPMTGALTYDTATVIAGGDSNSSTNEGNFYFSTNSTFSFSMNIGPHTFANVPHTNMYPYADIIIHDNYYGQDSFNANDSSPYVFMDGGTLPTGIDGLYLSLDLEDNTATAYSTDVLPLTPPVLANFADVHRAAVVGMKGNSFLFQITMTVTSITGSAIVPTLNIKSQPNKNVVLSWPLSAQGFGLEQNTNLVAGIGWKTNSTPVVDTATEHTVTLPASTGASFFRLKAP